MASSLFTVVALALLHISSGFVGPNFKVELDKDTKTSTTPAPTTPSPSPKAAKPDQTGDASSTFGANTASDNLPPHILEKMRQVRDIRDFVRVFKIQGVKIEKPQPVDPPPVPQTNEVYTVNVNNNGVVTRMALGGDNTGCEPRQVVEEIPNQGGLASMIYPSCVLVNRCSGCCIKNKYVKCMPSEITTVKKALIRLYFSGKYETISYDVKHHKQCQCKCVLTKQDCGPLLVYNKDTCQCTCNKKETCPTVNGVIKQWSDRQCKCICSSQTKCTANRVWDDDNCRCRCTREPCPPNWERDRNTCECSISLSRGAQSFRCFPVDDKKPTTGN